MHIQNPKKTKRREEKKMIVKFKDLGNEICINANKAVLNTIALMAWDAACRAESLGYYAVKAEYENYARSIHDVLDAAGYYDDCE